MTLPHHIILSAKVADIRYTVSNQLKAYPN